MLQKIKFGPAGLGPVKQAISNLEHYHSLGLRACEISFTYGVYIKNKEDAIKIGNVAKKLGITLSIHASYFINLNSVEKEKVEKSKERILDCCKVGTLLGAKYIVFHPGYYGKMDKEETYQNIKKEMLNLQEIIKKEKYTPILAPETTGKINVFGSVDDILRLVKDTKCLFCIDFAHILAREKDYQFEEVLTKFNKYKKMHIHFSGIVYTEKGERHHKKTPESEWKKLISALLKFSKIKEENITIINESPFTVEDSLEGIKIYNSKK